MIFLEDQHPALLEAARRLTTGENAIPKSTVRDFDGNRLHLEFELDTPATGEVENASFVSAAGDAGRSGTLRVWLQPTLPLATFTKNATFVAALFDTLLPAKFDDAPEDCVVKPSGPDSAKYLCGLKIHTTHSSYAHVLQEAAKLRTFALMAPLYAMVEQFQSPKATFAPIRLAYRANESLYVFVTQKSAQFSVIISISANGDADDRLMIKHFLQSFQDTKKLDRTVAAAPAFSFTQGVAPADLPRDVLPPAEPETDDTFWVSIQLFKKQLEMKNLEKTVNLIINFRNYVAYHIRGCRSYMHAQMRARVDESVKILNRAKTSTTGRSRVQI